MTSFSCIEEATDVVNRQLYIQVHDSAGGVFHSVWEIVARLETRHWDNLKKKRHISMPYWSVIQADWDACNVRNISP